MADKYLQESNDAPALEVLRQLDLALFARLFSRMVGGEHGLFLFDTDLNPISSTDQGLLSTILAEIAKGSRSAVELVFSDCLDLEALGKLIAIPLEKIENTGTGMLAALVAPGASEEETQAFRAALDDISQAINQVCRKEFELNDMTDEVSVRYEELNIVYDFGNIIKRYLRGEALYQTLLQLCVDRLEVDLAVFLHPEDEMTTYVLAPDKQFNELDLLLTRMRSEVFRFVASSKEPLIVNRMDDPRRGYLWSGMPYKFLAAPIIFQKRMKALLVILRNNDGHDFSNSDRKLMGVICEQVATLIHNEEMYTALFVFTEQMAAALIEAVDAKDPYTRGHSERVNYYAMQLGKAKRLSEVELQVLYWGSLLHDLGKIAVPDMVLSKLGKLDDDEYTLMKTHPERGFDILKKIERLQKSLPGVRHHHERFDGEGYPHGLAGEDIPLHARIIAIADTYDAITSSRSYRSARGHEQAMTIINEVSGSQLDPTLVALWNHLMETSPEIYQKKLTFPQHL